jgi:hypothetical protein
MIEWMSSLFTWCTIRILKNELFDLYIQGAITWAASMARSSTSYFFSRRFVSYIFLFCLFSLPSQWPSPTDYNIKILHSNRQSYVTVFFSRPEYHHDPTPIFPYINLLQRDREFYEHFMTYISSKWKSILFL